MRLLVGMGHPAHVHCANYVGAPSSRSIITIQAKYL